MTTETSNARGEWVLVLRELTPEMREAWEKAPSRLTAEWAALLAAAPPPAAARGDVRGLADYDAGLLNDFGGGDVNWWQDYLRAEIERANEFWREQTGQALAAEGVQAGEVEQRARELLAIECGVTTSTIEAMPSSQVKVSEAIRAIASALSQQPEARQITPEWVIGYFPANVAQQYRNAVSDAFAEFAALHPKPEARGVVDELVEIRDEALRCANADTIGGDTDALKRAMRRLAERCDAALTGERNG